MLAAFFWRIWAECLDASRACAKYVAADAVSTCGLVDGPVCWAVSRISLVQFRSKACPPFRKHFCAPPARADYLASVLMRLATHAFREEPLPLLTTGKISCAGSLRISVLPCLVSESVECRESETIPVGLRFFAQMWPRSSGRLPGLRQLRRYHRLPLDVLCRLEADGGPSRELLQPIRTCASSRGRPDLFPRVRRLGRRPWRSVRLSGIPILLGHCSRL
ncbi:uncharacterized protein B0H18DRAFT_96447 [Fomitopsis serialis]|uniref:uncharacterized protein n=1 Tax=Fomitopsis serialis TaxID=139415 RepID=UPI0020074419|nr:uncharacterized protein B0H18DRAFT_96447 [Neoantrodia serialis]KAH9915515.1 hypothetical protein B0H18DRAFT_96447 [Neoantrodia serialis]